MIKAGKILGEIGRELSKEFVTQKMHVRSKARVVTKQQSLVAY